MRFSDKLDFLMSMTKTTNSALAHFLVLDASYISRLRTGKRRMPKDRELISRICGYLAERLSYAANRSIVLDLVKAAPDDNLAGSLADWLMRDNRAYTGAHDEAYDSALDRGGAEVGQVERFLSNLSSLAPSPAPKTPPSPDTSAEMLTIADEPVQVFYGAEGKRRAAELFLTEVAQSSKPQTLLLHSSEEMSWLTDDPAFTAKWAALMFSVLSRGNRIKIIHAIDRGFDEMLDSIASWMPLYMSGLIEPYYYPKKRDNVFKQTMFIAPQTAAVVSQSVNNETANAANILLRNKEAVAAFVTEFNEYLSLCRPLLKIFTERDRGAFLDTLIEFEKGEVDAIEKTSSLSTLTMPKALLAELLEDTGSAAEEILTLHALRVSNFKKLLKTCSFTEIISLPEVEKLLDGKLSADMSMLMQSKTATYTPEGFIKHLQSIIALLKANGNYHVHIAEAPLDERYIVYCREDRGVIVAKTSQPPITLASNESQLNAAFWDFLRHFVIGTEYDRPNNAKAAARLQEYIAEVKAAM